jgi:hypothetical protein
MTPSKKIEQAIDAVGPVISLHMRGFRPRLELLKLARQEAQATGCNMDTLLYKALNSYLKAGIPDNLLAHDKSDLTHGKV